MYQTLNTQTWDENVWDYLFSDAVKWAHVHRVFFEDKVVCRTCRFHFSFYPHVSYSPLLLRYKKMFDRKYVFKIYYVFYNLFGSTWPTKWYFFIEIWTLNLHFLWVFATAGLRDTAFGNLFLVSWRGTGVIIWVITPHASLL